MEEHCTRFSRLASDMETAIERVRRSRLYANVVAQWNNDPAIASHVARVLRDDCVLPIMMYGIDSIEHSRQSKHSLSLALALTRHAAGLPFRSVEVRHANLDPTELAVVRALGCRIASTEEHWAALRADARPTLFFVSSSRRGLLGELLEENWLPARLNRMIIFAERFETIANSIADKVSKRGRYPTISCELSHQIERLRFAWAIQPSTQEVKMFFSGSSDEDDNEHYNNFGWHFFDLSLHTNMEALVPSLRGCINRKSFISYISSIDEEEFGEVSRLRQDMEIAIEEVRCSDIYRETCRKLQENPCLKGELGRRFHFGRKVQMVIYGVGSPECWYLSQNQLALALLLKWEAEILDIGEIQVFDPLLTLPDVAVMQSFGCTVLRIDEKCARRVEKPTLFCMPGCPYGYLADLIRSNCIDSSQMEKIVIVGNVPIVGNLPRTASRGNYVRNELDRNGDKCADLIIPQFCTVYPFANSDIRGLDDLHWMFFNLNEISNLKEIISGLEDTRIRSRSWSLANREWYLSYQENEKSFWRPTTGDDIYLRGMYAQRARPPRRIRQIWSPPHRHWMKLNFSSVNTSTGGAGFGGVFHNEHGELLLAYAGPCHTEESCSCIGAGVLGLKMGLLCLKRFFPAARRLMIETDDLRVTRWVMTCDRGGILQSYYAHWEEIRELAADMICQIYQVYEVANAKAIEVATCGAHLPDFCCEMHGVPYDMSDI